MKIVWSFIFIILVGGLVLTIHFISGGNDPEGYRRKYVLSLSFSGRIKAKFHDKEARGNATIILESGESIYVASSSLIDSTLAGDSVKKEKGILYYRVYRGNDSFDCYPTMRGEEIKE